MYESPKDILDGLIPQERIPFTPLARLAGALYLLSLVVPFLSDRLGYAVYYPPSGRDPLWFNLPINIDLILLPIEGTLAGPAKTAATADTAARGITLGFIDLVFTPFLIFGLPITGFVLAVLPIVLGGLLLTGYKKHLVGMSFAYIGTLSLYSMMLGIKSVGFLPHIGAWMCMLASLILVALILDRTMRIGLVSGNGYTLPEYRKED